MNGTPPTRPRTNRVASLFLLSAAWIVLSLAVAGEVTKPVPVLWEAIVREIVAAALLAGGFYAIARAYIADLRPLSSIGFVRRPGIAAEFGRGAALGWAIAIALVLPAMLTGNLDLTFSFTSVAITHFFVSAVVLTAFALVVQLVLAGLPLRLLVRATGPAWATAAVIFVVTCLAISGQGGQGRGLIFMALSASLFVAGYLRTRAIWLPLGLQIGWTLGLQLLFGANSPYTPVTYGIVQSDAGGPAWLTGGPFGPEASAFAVLVLIAALVALFRITRDYAWHYTWQPIEGAGAPVVIAPPEEHIREEKKHAAAAPLVQIGGIAPASPAAPDLPATPRDPIL
ncbi:hypothetical protein Terro_1945 [Terriglobus roseus DSM 18391]|uniref:CAAX protease self-immunity n=1 Tax=Terriglobus roseus (strain DSM 18391 / NRRL B-41598 / KBS 63) TaxID=926566 RepID=I3ZG63_TERRK|nr:hypothetical protein [Terriglobus roseus]AFL88231.1 hypothetical protein Terro_1945 [Terriglobus roseus DSM 18391]